jgi:hypothetical protein
MPGDNQEWFKKCLGSLEGEPVSVYVCNGIKEDIGNARADAFLLGDNEYVSFIDPDDYVLPGGFSACVEQLRKHNSVVAYTQEIVVGFTGEIYKNPLVRDWVHHLIVFRRDIVIDNLQIWRDWCWGCNLSEGQVFVNHLKDKKHKISSIKKPYYVWRRHIESYTMRKRLNDNLV